MVDCLFGKATHIKSTVLFKSNQIKYPGIKTEKRNRLQYKYIYCIKLHTRQIFNERAVTQLLVLMQDSYLGNG